MKETICIECKKLICNRCDRKDVKILGNGYCERCDKAIYEQPKQFPVQFPFNYNNMFTAGS